jgi:hypothetical protein
MKLVTGSIFDAPLTYALVVPVNTAGIPGAGLAYAAAWRYPLWKYAYLGACRSRMLAQPGDVVIHHVPNNKRRLMVSFATKGRQLKKNSDLEAIAHGLEALALELTKEPFPLAIPALGCGLGGLDFWLQVYPIIDRKLGKFENVLLYQPKGGRHVQ